VAYKGAGRQQVNQSGKTFKMEEETSVRRGTPTEERNSQFYRVEYSRITLKPHNLGRVCFHTDLI
jgi:hypothetical protein